MLMRFLAAATTLPSRVEQVNRIHKYHVHIKRIEQVIESYPRAKSGYLFRITDPEDRFLSL